MLITPYYNHNIKRNIMETISPIKTDLRNGNLHVNVHGLFDASIAEHVTNRIAAEYNGYGNIFIHTDEVTTVHPQAREVLGELIDKRHLPQQKLYLTGRQGFAVGPDNIKVIAHRDKKEKCCGRCRDCKCHDKPDHAALGKTPADGHANHL